MEVLNRAIESIMNATDRDEWEPTVIHVTDNILSLWRGEVPPLPPLHHAVNPPGDRPSTDSVSTLSLDPDRKGRSLSGSVRCVSSPFWASATTATPSP